MSHITLVHGLGCSPRYFEPLRQQLAPTHDVLVPELPGFGGSARPERPWSVEDYAAHLITLLERAGVARTVLAGQSMGAQFVVEVAAQRPDLVAGIVLIGPVTDAARRSALRQGFALARDVLREPPRTSAVVFIDYLRCGIRWFLAELPAMIDYRIEDRLRDVAAPVLVMRGSLDPIARAGWAGFLADRAPRGTVSTIQGAPHNAHHAAPVPVADAIVAFLASSTSAAQSDRGSGAPIPSAST